MKRRKNPFPGVNTVEDRHGKLRHRLRRSIRGRTIDIYLPGPYGSPEFRAAYEEAREGTRVATRRAQPGTIGYLIVTYLETAAFRNLAPITRRNKRGRLDWIRTAVGEARYDAMQPRHIESLMEKKGGPEAANHLRKDLRQLFAFAAKRYGYKGQNPAALADTHKVRSGGYHSWTDDEVETFRAAHPTGSKARLALELFFGTGAARQDAAAITRANIRGDRIVYCRGKTGQEVDLPIILLPELTTELAHLPADQMMLISRNDGRKGYTPESLGNWFRDRCTEAGLPHCAAHGLRKAGARRLAEAGASEYEVMSFLGHRSAKVASRYVAAANRATLATSGMAKLGRKSGTNVSNLPRRLDKRGM